jgi:hypothetical protein
MHYYEEAINNTSSAMRHVVPADDKENIVAKII